MVGMGYNMEEIQESLAKMKYDEITATYLLLGRKASEVRASTHYSTQTKRKNAPLWFLTLSFLSLQMETGESASSSNLSLAKTRPNSELNGQSPSHLKVQRSASSNHKQRRYSEQGNAQICL